MMEVVLYTPRRCVTQMTAAAKSDIGETDQVNLKGAMEYATSIALYGTG